MKINFSRGVGGSLSYFVEIPGGGGGGGGGGVLFLEKGKNGGGGGGGGGGGVLSEIPSVVGYGYFWNHTI